MISLVITITKSLDDTVMEVSIEKSQYNDKSRYYDAFSDDRSLSILRDFTVPN